MRITSLLKWNSCGQQFILQFLGSARRQLAPQEFLDLARFRVEKLCQDFDVVKLPNWRGSPVVALVSILLNNTELRQVRNTIREFFRA